MPFRVCPGTTHAFCSAMTNATSTRLTPERRERDENRYLDPASERYATQLAAVVFGWGTWSVGPLADEELLADSARTLRST